MIGPGYGAFSGGAGNTSNFGLPEFGQPPVFGQTNSSLINHIAQVKTEFFESTVDAPPEFGQISTAQIFGGFNTSETSLLGSEAARPASSGGLFGQGNTSMVGNTGDGLFASLNPNASFEQPKPVGTGFSFGACWRAQPTSNIFGAPQTSTANTGVFGASVTVEDCKKRWLTIKDTCKLQKRSGQVGQTGSDVKNNTAKWQLSDAVLDVAIYERQIMSNVSNESSAGDEKQNEISDKIDESVQSLRIREENEPRPFTSAVERANTRQQKQLLAGTRPTKKTKRSNASIEIQNARSQERKKSIEQLSKTEDDDPTDVFFKSMSLTVKQFSPELKIKVKFDVLRIVSELELKNLQQKEIISSPSVQTHSFASTSHRFPEIVSPCPRENRNAKYVCPADSYNSPSTSLDGECVENPEKYWIHSLNK